MASKLPELPTLSYCFDRNGKEVPLPKYKEGDVVFISGAISGKFAKISLVEKA